jgi:FAD/FMN-containing dehydrogenase
LDDTIWPKLRSALDARTSFRLSGLPSRIGALWEHARRFADEMHGVAAATISRGTVRLALPDASMLPTAEASSHEAETITCIGERLPASLWSAVTSNPSTKILSERVRRSFDPDGVLNPGILGA